MQTSDTQTKASYPNKSTRRFVATLAAVSTIAFAVSAAVPTASAATGVGCPVWQCGSNHNEVMASPLSS